MPCRSRASRPLRTGENVKHFDVALIDAAKHEIDLAAYVLTDWPVMQALTRAADRGDVKVSAAMRSTKRTADKYLVEQESRAVPPAPDQAPAPKIGDAVKMLLKGNKATLVSWMRQHIDAESLLSWPLSQAP